MAYANRIADLEGSAATGLSRLRGEQSRPTIYDVASAVGVSPITVSRALNGGSCKAETREAVVQAARRLGYEPNAAAQALAARKRKRPQLDSGRAGPGDAAASMPQVWQSYAEMMLRLMRPQ